jgi:plastocyanin
VWKLFRYWGYAEPEELTIDAGETISFGWDAKRAENAESKM